jgi:hypothetical protein
MRYNPLWGLPSHRPILDIQNPNFDLTPPIESIQSIERQIKYWFGQYPSSGIEAFTAKHVKALTEMRMAPLDEHTDEDEDDLSTDLCCDDCGEELGNDYHTIDKGLLRRNEHLCPDCFRKRNGPFRCDECGGEFSSGDIDWKNSDRDAESYICLRCSWKDRYGSASSDEDEDGSDGW